MKIFITTLFLTFLNGCSQFEIVYRNAETLMEWRVGGYLEQTGEDEFILQQNIHKLLNWHRDIMLPSYSKFLEKQLAIIEKGRIDRAQILEAIVASKKLLEETIKGGSPFVAAVLKRHTSVKKLSYLKLRIKEERDDEQKSFDSENDLTARRENKVKSNLRSLMGSANEVQMMAVDRYVKATSKFSQFWIERREKREKDLISFLSQDPTVDEIERFLVTLLIGPEKESMSEAWWVHFSHLLIEVFTSLEQKQRLKLIVSLHDYIRDMKAISQNE